MPKSGINILIPVRPGEVLKWAPLYSLEKGLAETIAWYKDFLEKTV